MRLDDESVWLYQGSAALGHVLIKTFNCDGDSSETKQKHWRRGGGRAVIAAESGGPRLAVSTSHGQFDKGFR